MTFRFSSASARERRELRFAGEATPPIGFNQSEIKRELGDQLVERKDKDGKDKNADPSKHAEALVKSCNDALQKHQEAIKDFPVPVKDEMKEAIKKYMKTTVTDFDKNKIKGLSDQGEADGKSEFEKFQEAMHAEIDKRLGEVAQRKNESKKGAEDKHDKEKQKQDEGQKKAKKFGELRKEIQDKMVKVDKKKFEFQKIEPLPEADRRNPEKIAAYIKNLEGYRKEYQEVVNEVKGLHQQLAGLVQEMLALPEKGKKELQVFAIHPNEDKVAGALIAGGAAVGVLFFGVGAVVGAAIGAAAAAAYGAAKAAYAETQRAKQEQEAARMNQEVAGLKKQLSKAHLDTQDAQQAVKDRGAEMNGLLEPVRTGVEQGIADQQKELAKLQTQFAEATKAEEVVNNDEQKCLEALNTLDSTPQESLTAQARATQRKKIIDQLAVLGAQKRDVRSVLDQIKPNIPANEAYIAAADVQRESLLQTDTQIGGAVLQGEIEMAEEGGTAASAMQQLRELQDVQAPSTFENLTSGFAGIGSAAEYVFNKQIAGGLDDFSAFIKKNVPNKALASVLSFPVEVASGFSEGVGGLVQGVTTMITNPVETAKGIAMLAEGLYAYARQGVTGEKREIDEQSKDAVDQALGAMIAYDKFKNGESGKAVGELALNVLTTATGAGAAANAAKTARLAYRVARASGTNAVSAGLKSGAIAVTTGTSEFVGGLAKVTRNGLSGVGKLAKLPVRLVKRPKKEALLAAEQVAKSQELLNVRDALKRTKLPDNVKMLKTPEELEALLKDPKRMAELGITPSSASDLLRYQDLLKEEQALAKRLDDIAAERSQIGANASAAENPALPKAEPAAPGKPKRTPAETEELLATEFKGVNPKIGDGDSILTFGSTLEEAETKLAAMLAEHDTFVEGIMKSDAPYTAAEAAGVEKQIAPYRKALEEVREARGAKKVAPEAGDAAGPKPPTLNESLRPDETIVPGRGPATGFPDIEADVAPTSGSKKPKPVKTSKKAASGKDKKTAVDTGKADASVPDFALSPDDVAALEKSFAGESLTGDITTEQKVAKAKDDREAAQETKRKADSTTQENKELIEKTKKENGPEYKKKIAKDPDVLNATPESVRAMREQIKRYQKEGAEQLEQLQCPKTAKLVREGKFAEAKAAFSDEAKIAGLDGEEFIPVYNQLADMEKFAPKVAAAINRVEPIVKAKLPFGWGKSLEGLPKTVRTAADGIPEEIFILDVSESGNRVTYLIKKGDRVKVGEGSVTDLARGDADKIARYRQQVADAKVPDSIQLGETAGAGEKLLLVKEDGKYVLKREPKEAPSVPSEPPPPPAPGVTEPIALSTEPIPIAPGEAKPIPAAFAEPPAPPKSDAAKVIPVSAEPTVLPSAEAAKVKPAFAEPPPSSPSPKLASKLPDTTPKSPPPPYPSGLGTKNPVSNPQLFGDMALDAALNQWASTGITLPKMEFQLRWAIDASKRALSKPGAAERVARLEDALAEVRARIAKSPDAALPASSAASVPKAAPVKASRRSPEKKAEAKTEAPSSTAKAAEDYDPFEFEGPKKTSDKPLADLPGGPKAAPGAKPPEPSSPAKPLAGDADPLTYNGGKLTSDKPILTSASGPKPAPAKTPAQLGADALKTDSKTYAQIEAELEAEIAALENGTDLTNIRSKREVLKEVKARKAAEGKTGKAIPAPSEAPKPAPGKTPNEKASSGASNPPKNEAPSGNTPKPPKAASEAPKKRGILDRLFGPSEKTLVKEYDKLLAEYYSAHFDLSPQDLLELAGVPEQKLPKIINTSSNTIENMQKLAAELGGDPVKLKQIIRADQLKYAEKVAELSEIAKQIRAGTHPQVTKAKMKELKDLIAKDKKYADAHDGRHSEEFYEKWGKALEEIDDKARYLASDLANGIESLDDSVAFFQKVQKNTENLQAAGYSEPLSYTPSKKTAGDAKAGKKADDVAAKAEATAPELPKTKKYEEALSKKDEVIQRLKEMLDDLKGDKPGKPPNSMTPERRKIVDLEERLKALSDTKNAKPGKIFDEDMLRLAESYLRKLQAEFADSKEILAHLQKAKDGKVPSLKPADLKKAENIGLSDFEFDDFTFSEKFKGLDEKVVETLTSGPNTLKKMENDLKVLADIEKSFKELRALDTTV
jgi:hypothetical protein